MTRDYIPGLFATAVVHTVENMTMFRSAYVPLRFRPTWNLTIYGTNVTTMQPPALLEFGNDDMINLGDDYLASHVTLLQR